MSDNGKRNDVRLGFLAAVEVGESGFVGGLLVTNRLGRPLEFQCTTPVVANPTQRILYGPTLAPWLLTDLVGRTLLEKATLLPDLVLVDRPEMADLRELIDVPLAWIVEADDEDIGGLAVGRQRLVFHSEFPEDATAVERHRPLIPAEADLGEPFERVREALQETVGKSSQERAA